MPGYLTYKYFCEIPIWKVMKMRVLECQPFFYNLKKRLFLRNPNIESDENACP